MVTVKGRYVAALKTTSVFPVSSDAKGKVFVSKDVTGVRVIVSCCALLVILIVSTLAFPEFLL
jgi:hypothetical protein